MDLIGPIIEIFKCVCPPLCKYVQYHRKLDDKMNDLKRELKGLKKKKEDIEATLSRAKREQGKKPSNEANDWLENVKRISNEAERIEQEVKKRKYFARARLGKDVEEKIQEVEKYHQLGRSFTAENLVSDDPSTSGRILSTTKILVGKQTEEIMQKIWDDLMDDKVSKIGVWGMGGIGKTTIMKEINNRLQEKANKFNDVIWITVSQPLNLNKLQNDIATALNQSLPATDDQERRAAMLLGMLKAKVRFALILDDMWEAFHLEEVGIPEPSEENGCKLLITTRSADVCHFMGCKEVRIEPLSEHEGLNLFLNKVGIKCISQVPTLEEIITAVVQECAGLPLAIVTVAASMRGVHEIREWRNALNELRGLVRSMKGIDTAVFERLEFSYRRLKDEKVQQCFLYCALFPDDYEISKDELIDYWLAEGLIEEAKNVHAKYDRGYTVLNRLVNCCLLESAEGGRCVKMHDLIREMALRITSDQSPLFMVKAGTGLTEFPGEREWKENLERVSLMENKIMEIPSNMSPPCEILSTLLLQGNRFLHGVIPDCFFVHMHGLKILNLSSTNIELLPNSVSDLMNLRSLLLRECWRLKRVPSVAKLLALQYLDLERTPIEKVPEGMEMLENLSHLHLSPWLPEKFPAGILPRLRNLYKLGLHFGREPLRETVEEAASLSDRLDTFEGHFYKLKDFNIHVKSADGRGSKIYFLLLWAAHILDFTITDLKEDKSVWLVDCKICEREETIVLPEDVQSLGMSDVCDVTSLNDVLPREQGLVNIGKFSHDLKALRFNGCHNLKNLFSLRLLPALQNLENLQVRRCDSILEIVAVEDEETEKELATNTIIKTVKLPRLKKLRVHYLPALRSICGDNAVLVCNSLQEIEVYGCPRLKRLSLRLPLLDNGGPSPPPALEVIEIEQELWESLEWDQANAKDVLNPYCQFVQI